MKLIKKIVLFLFPLSFFVSCTLGNSTKPDEGSFFTDGYYFDQPARIWEETIPLGNGRIGLMPDGGVEQERIVLNEISMWSGRKQNTDNPAAAIHLPKIRQLLFEGKNKEAQELMYQHFVCAGEGSGDGDGNNVPFGSFQLLGNLDLTFSYPSNNDSVVNYRRELNMRDAIASVSFQKGEVEYSREVHTSFSHDVGLIYLTADKDSMINFSLGMNRPERYTVFVEGDELVIQGQLNDGDYGDTGMKYAARVHVKMPRGGSIGHSDKTLTIRDASEVIIYVCMATNYMNDNLDEQLANMFRKSSQEKYEILRENHVAEYRKLYDRVEVSFGQTDNAALPIDQRLHAFNRGEPDPGLMALYFQFGRYLLISSTRPGSLPPNLQGLWANEVQSPWNGDYHLNINVQMNHWPAEITNLSELHMPLIEWTKSQVKSGERTAKVFYNARGWVTHIIGNLWKFTAPTKFPAWGATNTCAAWLCRHMYEHYLFTKDTTYLREVYPMMREAALFFTDVLVENPSTGYLVTAPTNSPENAFIDHSGNVVSVCAGTTMDNQIIRELFSNTIAAAELLSLDSIFVAELKEKRSRLMPTTIGPDGRIMEWLEPYEEVEPEHRHVSHLFGLFPGSEISSELTPDLAEAARKSLTVRGDVSTGWSMAWKVNFWARLRDGEHAYKLLTDLLRPSVDSVTLKTKGGGTYPNLFCAHPPFQIDGNFGGCAGIAEMLLQSQSNCVEILPALPTAWQTGYYKGLKARGGGEVSASWKDGHLQTASLKCVVESNEFRIKLPAGVENVRAKIDRRTAQLPVVNGMLTIELQRNQELFLDFTGSPYRNSQD